MHTSHNSNTAMQFDVASGSFQAERDRRCALPTADCFGTQHKSNIVPHQRSGKGLGQMSCCFFLLFLQAGLHTMGTRHNSARQETRIGARQASSSAAIKTLSIGRLMQHTDVLSSPPLQRKHVMHPMTQLTIWKTHSTSALPDTTPEPCSRKQHRHCIPTAVPPRMAAVHLEHIL